MSTLRARRMPWAFSAIGLIACGSLADSDPQFWQRSSDLGGKNYEFGAPAGSTGGAPASGGGGQTSESGGATEPLPLPSGTGNAPPPLPSGGAGGAFFTGGTTSTGGVPPDPSSTGTSQPPPPPPTGDPKPCSFEFAVTTVTARGRYAPRNVGAIWISDAQGKIVKALEVWGQIRLANATAWTSASAGARVDVVTAATKPSHGPHTVAWDCTGPTGSPVPYGTYQAHVTFAESDAFPFFGPAPIQASLSFERNGQPIETQGAGTSNFTAMRVVIR